jgi:hypothetical protein
MIPLIICLKIRPAQGKGFGLWFPFFLVWILLFTIFLLLLPLMILVEIILALCRRYIPIIGIFWQTLTVMTKLPGTQIHVKKAQENKKVDISIY